MLLLLCWMYSIPCKAGLTTPDEASTSIGACKLATRGYHLTVTQSNRTAAQQTGNLDTSAGGNSSTNSSNGLQSLKDPFVASIAAALCPPNSYQDGETTQQQCTPCPHGLRTEQVRPGLYVCRTFCTSISPSRPRGASLHVQHGRPTASRCIA